MTTATANPPAPKTKEKPDEKPAKRPMELAASPAAVPEPPFVNEPGIVWYENSSKNNQPTAAICLRRNERMKTCTLLVVYGMNGVGMGYVKGRIVENVRHITDPALAENPNWRSVGAWDFTPRRESTQPQVANDILSGVTE